MSNKSVVMGRRYPLMCYSRKDRDLEREARWITEKRLMEEEARHRQEEHDRRRAKEEEKPLIEKVKEVVGVR
jgi:protein subunit release factor B